MPPKKKAEVETPPVVDDGAAEGDQGAGEDGADTADPEARIAELEDAVAAAAGREAELNETVSELKQQLADGASTPSEEPRSGKTRRITYLGRPHLLARNDDGDVTEDDVYSSTDPWSDIGNVTLHVGESAMVSAEKADQLAADDPDSFEIE